MLLNRLEVKKCGDDMQLKESCDDKVRTNSGTNEPMNECGSNELLKNESDVDEPMSENDDDELLNVMMTIFDN